jgi:hypothetical protein
MGGYNSVAIKRTIGPEKETYRLPISARISGARELGKTAAELAGQMGLTPPAISLSVKRDEGIDREKGRN